MLIKLFQNNSYIYSCTICTSSAEVLEENNFYPFGLKHEGYNAQAGNPSYYYQYNGKELQKETGWSDYGARMYMSDIGRWGVTDPLAEQMRRYSPYTYAYNNPIRFIDPDGRKPQTQEEEISLPMAPITMLMFYASGGSTNNRALMDFVGQPDRIGDFYSVIDKLQSVDSNGGGGAPGGNSVGTSGNNSREEVDVELEGVTITGKKGVSSYNMMLLHLALLNSIEKQLEKLDFNNWYSNAGKVNWFVGAAGAGVGNFANRFYIGTARSNAPVNFLGTKFYGNGRTFIKATHIGTAIGRFSFGLGVAMDGVGVYNYYYNKGSENKVHPAKAGLNTVIGAYGLTGAGTIPALLYFGVDAFYPGGWEGYGNDYQRIQSENEAVVPGFITAPYGSQKF